MSPSRKPSERTGRALLGRHGPVLGLAGTLVACASTAAPLISPSEPSLERRRPDGVAVDPDSALPEPRPEADAARGLIALRAPLPVELAFGLVGELFQCVIREDSEGLDAVFTRDARALASNGSGGTPTQAGLWWEQRFRRMDYTRLAGEALYREAEIVILRGTDERAAAPALRADPLEPEDVLLLVPVRVPRLGQERFFGPELLLWMRRDGDRYRIYRVAEDFQLP